MVQVNCSTTNNIRFDKVFGIWDFQIITINNQQFKAQELNECKYQDKLIIEQNSNQIDDVINFNRKKIKLSWIGKSKEKECALNPETFNHEIITNSCKSEWYQSIPNNNTVYEIYEGRINLYKLKLINEDSLLLIGMKYEEFGNEGILNKVIQLSRNK